MSSAKGISTGGPRAARSKTGTATSEIYYAAIVRIQLDRPVMTPEVTLATLFNVIAGSAGPILRFLGKSLTVLEN